MARQMSTLLAFGRPCHADVTQSTSSYESNTVTIVHNGAKATNGSDDASGTLRVHADSFSMYNIKVVNSYGIGSQALALSASGVEQVRTVHITAHHRITRLPLQGFYGCSFVGWQDTIYTSTGTQYFGHSYIEGAVGECYRFPLSYT